MKIRPVRVDFFNADGQTRTDMMKLIIAFSNFANAAKNNSVTLCVCMYLCMYVYVRTYIRTYVF